MAQRKRLKLDEIDRQILQILQEDGRITNAQLSKDIGLSPAPTLERVKKLEQAGIIESYHAVVNKEKVGLGVMTFVQVSLISHKKSVIERFVEKINKIDSIIECYYMTGAADFLLKIVAEDIAAYQKLMLEQVSEIEEIEHMQSMVVLSVFKQKRALPIPEDFIED